MIRIVVLSALVLSGCAKDPPPPPEGLRRPVAWAMVRCPPLPDAPVNNGDPAVRAPVDKTVRLEYVACAARVDALIDYVETVAPKK